jgi:D-lactate dehydrogenase
VDHFHRDGLTGGECAGRTLVVVGVGRIGHEVAQIGRGLGLHVLGVDIEPRHKDLTYLPWAEAAPRADIRGRLHGLESHQPPVLSGGNPGPAETRRPAGQRSPGRVGGPDATRTASTQGLLGGLAMDVFEEENRVADALRGLATPTPAVEQLRQLARRPNVIFTPHNAFNTLEAVERKSLSSVEQLVHFWQQGRFRWPWHG